MGYTIKYKEANYPDLLIKCAHDTHHDFFYNKEPMKVEIQKGAGTDIQNKRQKLNNLFSTSPWLGEQSSIPEKQGMGVWDSALDNAEALRENSKDNKLEDNEDREKKRKSWKDNSTLKRQNSIPIEEVIYKGDIDGMDISDEKRCSIMFDLSYLEKTIHPKLGKRSVLYDVPIDITEKTLNEIFNAIIKDPGDSDMETDEDIPDIFYNFEVGKVIFISGKKNRISYPIKENIKLDDIVKQNSDHFNYEKT